jgi:hypothetical protein
MTTRDLIMKLPQTKQMDDVLAYLLYSVIPDEIKYWEEHEDLSMVEAWSQLAEELQQ